MEVGVDWGYLAVPLLFTVLAVILASVFVKLRASEGAQVAGGAAKEGEEGEQRRAVEPSAEAEPSAGGGGGGGGGEAVPQPEGAEPGGAEDAGSLPGTAAVGAEGERDQGEAQAGGGPQEEGKRGGPEEEGEGKAAAPAAPTRTAWAAEQEPLLWRDQEERRGREEAELKPPEAEVKPLSQGAPAAAAAFAATPAARQEQEDDDDDDDEEEESKEEDQESENEKLVVKEPEAEEADEQFSFKYSPGKLRGSQYKTMMTKEELEEERRIQRDQLTAIFSLIKEKEDIFGEMSENDIKEQLRLYDI